VNVAGAGTTSDAVTVIPKNGTRAGIIWATKTAASTNQWMSVTYGSNLFVAVAYSGTGNRVMTSPDGVTWTGRTSAADNFWESVTYGNGLFVAVSSNGTGNRVMTSPDGITWTSRTSAANIQWRSVTYGNGLFIAVASGGTGNRVMTSPDGITWTSRTSATDNDWRSVTYGNGLFVAVSTTGTGNRVMTSPDGITWTSRTSAADNDWRSVNYGNGLFVAVASTGNGNRVMTSPDGITWTSRTSAADNSWYSVTYGNGLYVAVTGFGFSASTNRVMTSNNGIDWQIRSSVEGNWWNNVTFANGLFVALVADASDINRKIVTSADAFVPDAPTINTITPSGTSASLAFTAPASSGYDAISNYQYSIDNGSSWVTRSPVSTASPLVISGLTSGTNYQIKIRAVNSMGSGCGSEAVSTCVNPTSGGTIAAAQSGGSGFNPAAFTSSAAASGHTGTLEYKWQSSTTSSSAGFSDIASSNFDIYDAGSLTQTTWYKRLARVDCNSTWTGAAESNVLEVTIIPMASQPTAQPTALYFTTTGTNPYNFVGKFTASASATGYLVVRNTGSAPTFTPADGTEYTTGSQTGGVIVYSGALTTFTESSVTSNVRYFYAIYAFNGSGSTINYLTTSPLNGSALRSTTSSGSVPASATGTSVSFPGSGVTVNFPGGTPGTNLTVSKTTSAPSSNFQVNSSIRGKKPMYFTITSSSPSPVWPNAHRTCHRPA
jgi:predicted RecA/RadA family phage recombinase